MDLCTEDTEMGLLANYWK